MILTDSKQTLYNAMKIFNKTILPILLATTWISDSEFARNEFFFKIVLDNTF